MGRAYSKPRETLIHPCSCWSCLVQGHVPDSYHLPTPSHYSHSHSPNLIYPISLLSPNTGEAVSLASVRPLTHLQHTVQHVSSHWQTHRWRYGAREEARQVQQPATRSGSELVRGHHPRAAARGHEDHHGCQQEGRHGRFCCQDLEPWWCSRL